MGRLVTVQTGGRTVTGRVTATDEHGVALTVGDSEPVTQVVAWSDLGPGRVQVEFTRSEDD